MSEYFFTKLSRKNNFFKEPAKVDVYAIINPDIDYKNFIPILGTIPLSLCVIDNSTNKYVISGQKIVLLTSFNYVPVFKVDNFATVFPFPYEFILSKLTKSQKSILDTLKKECSTNKLEFFQIYVPTKK